MFFVYTKKSCSVHWQNFAEKEKWCFRSQDLNLFNIAKKCVHQVPHITVHYPDFLRRGTSAAGLCHKTRHLEQKAWFGLNTSKALIFGQPKQSPSTPHLTTQYHISGCLNKQGHFKETQHPWQEAWEEEREGLQYWNESGGVGWQGGRVCKRDFY